MENAAQTICIDCRYIGPRASGIGEGVRALIDHVPVMAPDLNFLLLKNPAFSGDLSTHRNVREVAINSPANGPVTMWWLTRHVDLSAVDLFHAPANILPAGLAMRTVTTIHDMMWIEAPQLCGAGAKWWLDRAFYRHGMVRALSKSHALITVSEASRYAIGRWSAAAASKTAIALSGVSTDFCPGVSELQVANLIGLPQGSQFVLTVGQYAPYKNHEGALLGFAAAFCGRPDVHFVLVQRMGRNATQILALADALGLAGRVHVLKPISRDELIALYRAAIVLLHPSFCEGFGNPLAEAMACGCPVVTSQVSAMPEVTAGAALLINPHDPDDIAAALIQIAESPSLAALLREKGLVRAAQLSWQDCASKTLAVYREVLAGPTA
jgi:glycosyltransferase involved in cell wall biosynthesis